MMPASVFLINITMNLHFNARTAQLIVFHVIPHLIVQTASQDIPSTAQIKPVSLCVNKMNSGMVQLVLLAILAASHVSQQVQRALHATPITNSIIITANASPISIIPCLPTLVRIAGKIAWHVRQVAIAVNAVKDIPLIPPAILAS